jgi:hypothetical protein
MKNLVIYGFRNGCFSNSAHSPNSYHADIIDSNP